MILYWTVLSFLESTYRPESPNFFVVKKISRIRNMIEKQINRLPLPLIHVFISYPSLANSSNVKARTAKKKSHSRNLDKIAQQHEKITDTKKLIDGIDTLTWANLIVALLSMMTCRSKPVKSIHQGSFRKLLRPLLLL